MSSFYTPSGTYTKKELQDRGANISKIPAFNKGAARSAEAESSPARQQQTAANTQQKRSDELKSLKLVPFEELDKGQAYANAGDTMPVIFCRRENNQGGLWVSPQLLDSSSDDFDQTFVYLISQGQASFAMGLNDFFIGGQNARDIDFGTTFNRTLSYSSDETVCPIGPSGPTCDHTNFNFLADPLGTNVGDVTRIRTIEQYATGVTIKVKPIYPDDVAPGTSLERYTLTVRHLNNASLTLTTVGTLTTSATGGITSITTSMSASNYTFSIENTAIHTAATDKPAAILIEFSQSNTFPTSYDRTSSYVDITLLTIEGNMYDPTKAYSVPSSLKQLHTFITSGIFVTKYRFIDPAAGASGGYSGVIASSNYIGDLMLWWFQNSGKLPNQNFQNFGINALARVAEFHTNYNITFNGQLTTTTNFYSYIHSISEMFLFSMFNMYGVYTIQPLLPLSSAYTIETGDLRGTINEAFSDSDSGTDSIRSSIVPGSYAKDYTAASARLPFQVVVTWRGQGLYNIETTQTTTVRYSDYPIDAPEETYDMTEFCTNAEHATIFAKYILAKRRYSTHTVSFQTFRNVLTFGLEPLDLISVTLTRTNSAGDNREELDYYLVESLTRDGSNPSTITATHFPLDAAGASIISNSVVSGSFEVTT